MASQGTSVENEGEIAGFRIRSLLADSGMARVYLATQLRAEREVALKVLPIEPGGDPEFEERFIRESRLAGSLFHPNVLPIYDVGKADEVIYLAMRYVAGGDLRRLLREHGQISAPFALEISRQIALALGAAHSDRLVHRDVKPSNILTDGDHAYLVDFGLAPSTGTRGLTRTGVIKGTPDYAAPEQLEGVREVDRRADIYSLGCVLYHCLAGQPPYVRESPAGVITAHLHEPVPQLAEIRPDLPRAVGAVVSKAMAKDPSDRFSTAPELAAALGAVLAEFDGVEISPKQSSRESDTTSIGEAPPEAPTPAPRPLEERRRSPSRRVVIATVGLAIGAAVIGVVFAFGSTTSKAPTSKPPTVPRVLGITAVRAEARLRVARFTTTIKHGASDHFAKGLVYRAKPSGRAVTIWISTGKPAFAVPYVVGTALSRAERELAEAHLELKKKSMPSARYPTGRVVRQMPGRGRSLPAGATMTLWVSTGPLKVLVPDVRGESAQQATRDLHSAGFRATNAGQCAATSRYSLAGAVAGQSPVAVKAPKRAVVRICLYYYVPPPPPPVTPPATTGVT